MNPRSALLSCDSFLSAFRLCMYPNGPADQRPSSEIVPAIVCLAFSAEVGLKGLLAVAGKSTRGHKLAVLFSALPPEQQQDIIERVGLEAQAFTAALALVSGVFEEWRYVHELTGELEVDDRFLNSIAKSVRDSLLRSIEA